MVTEQEKKQVFRLGIRKSFNKAHDLLQTKKQFNVCNSVLDLAQRCSLSS